MATSRALANERRNEILRQVKALLENTYRPTKSLRPGAPDIPNVTQIGNELRVRHEFENAGPVYTRITFVGES